MKRAFARWDTYRFLFDPDEPEKLWAEEECVQPLFGRSFWHSCGHASTREVRRAAEHGLAVQWFTPRKSCAWRRHALVFPAVDLAELLVALDSALEAGMPPRCARRIGVGTPPAPTAAHGRETGSGGDAGD